MKKGFAALSGQRRLEAVESPCRREKRRAGRCHLPQIEHQCGKGFRVDKPLRSHQAECEYQRQDQEQAEENEDRPDPACRKQGGSDNDHQHAKRRCDQTKRKDRHPGRQVEKRSRFIDDAVG